MLKLEKERFKIDDLSFHFKKVGKEKQMKRKKLSKDKSRYQ